MGAFLSLFSKVALFAGCMLLVAITPFSAWALNIHALYTSACQREVGVILKVDERYAYLLNLNGEMKLIRPYEIIYLAYYPAEFFPAQRKSSFDDVEQVVITTLIDSEPVELVRGWPLGYTADEISFLNESGHEQIIQRRSIYAIRFEKKSSPIQFELNGRAVDYEFQHPFAFRSCGTPAALTEKQIFPQQTLNQPVAIKRELDDLKVNYLRLERYAREQRFYAVPEVQKNQTSLGLWTSYGSRYGSSSGRSNNLTPVLTDSYSSDIFDYQHIFVTGSAPMSFGSHEEAQTQASYSMKASYFHFGFMVDPSLILVGTQYVWKTEDFSESDLRLNDTSFMEMGLDIGHFTFQLHFGNNIQLGAFAKSDFFEASLAVPRVGFSYQKPSWKVDGFMGVGSGTEVEKSGGDAHLTMHLRRINFFYFPNPKFNWQLSFLDRHIVNAGSFPIDSRSTTLAGYFGYRFWKRYEVKGFAALESMKQTIKGNSADKTVPKAGVAFSLYF